MRTAAWRLRDHVASLKIGRFAATIDLSRPADGLVKVRVDAHPLADTCLLGAVAGWLSAGDPKCLVDRYTRGPDVVAAYKESVSHPVRLDALWRAVGGRPADPFIVVVEMQVSVRTELLDSRPALAVRSDLAATEVLRLTEVASATYQQVPISPDPPVVMRPESGPGCLLFRLPGGELSYAEMVHPLDFRHDELGPSPQIRRAARISHRMFSERLEKGVILRARVQGVLLPRGEDARVAASCYAAFAAAEPPLST